MASCYQVVDKVVEVLGGEGGGGGELKILNLSGCYRLMGEFFFSFFFFFSFINSHFYRTHHSTCQQNEALKVGVFLWLRKYFQRFLVVFWPALP